MGTPVADHLDAVVADYLHRLDASAWSLPYDRRVELVGEIAEHIQQARAVGAVTTESSLLELLDRLGDPEEIIAAAREGEPVGPATSYPSPPPLQYRVPGIGLEIAAVLLMTVGSLIPFVGWVVGTILLWTSRRFRVGEKILMTLVVPGGPFIFVGLAVLVGGQTCSSGSLTDSTGAVIQAPETCSGFAFPEWLGIPLILVCLIAPFVIGGLLLKRAGERARAEQPVP
jgi:ribose/xylose/arabinose/galactoside ABC-type transport system permease subunit